MGQTTLTNQNSILAEIMSALKSGFGVESIVFLFANKKF